MCKSLKNWLTGYLLLICIIFLLAFISTGVAIYEYLRVVDGGLFPNSPVRSDWGVTGDFFGGVLNPILAFCSLIALLYTVHLNKQELEATRKELATTRATMNEQMEVSKQQRFESTFFSFLDQHNQVLKEISQDGENIHSLADSRKFSAFQVYDYLFRDGVKTTSMKHIKYTQIVVKKARDELKVGFSQINRYFHVLFQLLKLINKNFADGDNPTEKEKMYANIVRSCLTNEICYLLALFVAENDDTHNFIELKSFVIKYRLLKHMDFPNKKFVPNHLLLSMIVSAIGDKAFDKNPSFQRSDFSN